MQHTPDAPPLPDYFNQKPTPPPHTKALPTTPKNLPSLTYAPYIPNTTRSPTTPPDSIDHKRHAPRYSKLLPSTPSSISEIFSTTSSLPPPIRDPSAPKSLRTSHRVKTWEPGPRKLDERQPCPKPHRPPRLRRHSSSEEEIYFLRSRLGTWPARAARLVSPAAVRRREGYETARERVELLRCYIQDDSGRYGEDVEGMWAGMRERIVRLLSSRRDGCGGGVDERNDVDELIRTGVKMCGLTTVGVERMMGTTAWHLRDMEREENRMGVM
jgi:hypothetical protein